MISASGPLVFELSSTIPAYPSHALFPVQATPRSDFRGEVRVARAAAQTGARELRGHAAVQRAVWFLRLLEDAGKRPRHRSGELCGGGAPLQSHDDHVHWRRAALTARPRGPGAWRA